MRYLILCQACDHEIFYEKSDIRWMGAFPYVVCPECGKYIPVRMENA